MQPADLAFAGAVRQAELIRSGEVSSRELVELYLDRIFRLDQQLNAYREVLAEPALADASAADARRAAGEDAPLLGVPIAIKDDQDVAGVVTARGSIAHGGPAAADDEIVRRLREAGAVVLGKTNVPELMITPWTETPWYGATRNPWALDRTPGGSSGGSGAAVAAGLAAAATASDGGGSIRIPAAFCGLVGLKPQRGRMAGTKPNWHDLSTFGHVTRTVADTALLYDCTGDFPFSLAEAAARPPRRLRVAVSRGIPKGTVAKVDAEQHGAVDRMAQALRDLGHEVVDREIDWGLSGPHTVARYLAGINETAASMPHPRRLSRQTRGFARLGAGPARFLSRVLATEAPDRERILESIGDADVILTPMMTRPQLEIGELEGKPAGWLLNREIAFVPYCGVFNHTGQPAIAVPAGFTAEQLPLSTQFVGRPGSEDVLVSLAAQLEPVIGWADARPPVAA